MTTDIAFKMIWTGLQWYTNQIAAAVVDAV